MKKTAKFYKSHPEAREVKRKYDSEFQKRPAQVKKRTEANRANRKAGTYGNGDGLDASHTSKGIVMKKQSINRGSKKDSAGDRRARG